jgi:sugar/nucleoside kinase (ribokinase family)
MGKKTRLIGSVGPDFKDRFTADLERHGILHHITPSDETGGFSLIYYDDYGNRTLDLLGKAAVIDELDPSLYAASDAVLIGPILKEVPFELIKEIRRNFDGLFVCDPQGLLRGVDSDGRIYHEKPDSIEDVFALFDVVKPNELEGKVLTGIDCREDPYKAAKIIKSWGPKLVIVTLAELGSVIYDGETFIDIPPYEIDLVDATGAGDTYMAGFTFEYLNTVGKKVGDATVADLRTCGCYASCTSSIMIEQVGPEFTMSEAAIRERQATLLDMEGFKVSVAVNS